MEWDADAVASGGKRTFKKSATDNAVAMVNATDMTTNPVYATSRGVYGFS